MIEMRRVRQRGRRIYDEAVREAVITIWELTDRTCGKRLKAALPHLMESMERHGHLDLDTEVRDRLLSASAATLDRLLEPIRPTAGSRRRRRRGRPMGKRVPVRTYNDWNGPPPGFLEIDLVAHCGGSVSGSFIHSLVTTDICTGWPDHQQSGRYPSWPGSSPWLLSDWKPSRSSCPFPSLASTPITTARSSTKP